MTAGRARGILRLNLKNSNSSRPSWSNAGDLSVPQRGGPPADFFEGRRLAPMWESRRKEAESMTVESLKTLFEYNYWANRKLFQIMAQLASDQLTQNIGGSYESIRNTMVHILSAESGWLERCGGPERGPRLNPNDFPTLDLMIQSWAKLEMAEKSFLSQLDNRDLVYNIEFSLNHTETYSLRLGELLQHAAIHGVHHRGQIALLLRLLGYTPGNFDILVYYLERNSIPSRGTQQN
jgi:uncharacterized damage-inducible protein DinB